MNSKTGYDVLLTGASGQVGRYLLQELLAFGSVAVVMRRQSVLEAKDELRRLTGEPLSGRFNDVDIILGDLNTCELPDAEHIVNAAGFTSLSGPPSAYWKDNIMPAIRLAHHAVKTGGQLHQLSSVAVAEFRPDILRETSQAIPDERQLNYSTSKVFVELAVSAISSRSQIIRLGDVVPPIDRLSTDFRRAHWLSILFSSGPCGFDWARPDYTVWLADARELARAVRVLMDAPGRCYHALGKRYGWRFFRQHAVPTTLPRPALARWMTNIILHGPEGSEVNEDVTYQALAKEGFEWSTLDAKYWAAFAKRSVRR